MTKLLIAILATLALGLVALISSDRRRLFLVLFVLSLQWDLTLYLTEPSSILWVGLSGPEGFLIRIVTIPAVLLLIYWWKTRPPDMRLSWGKEVSLPAWLFIGTTALTILYGAERTLALCYVFELLQLLVILLAVINVVRSSEDLLLVVRLLLASLGIQCFVYLIQYGMDTSGDVLARHGGTISTRPAPFASFIVPLLLIAVARLLTADDARARFRMALLSGTGITVLILTLTRAAWMGFLLGFLWIALLGVKRQIVPKGRIVGLFLLGIMVSAPWLPQIAYRLSDRNEAYEERQALMRMAWKVIKANPVLGVGAGSYGHVFRQYVGEDAEGKWLFIVHNVYLLRWAETGIVGLAALLMLLLGGFRATMACTRLRDKDISTLSLGWCAGLVSLIWEMWWDITLGFQASALLWFMFGLMVAARRIYMQERRDPSVEPGAYLQCAYSLGEI